MAELLPDFESHLTASTDGGGSAAKARPVDQGMRPMPMMGELREEDQEDLAFRLEKPDV